MIKVRPVLLNIGHPNFFRHDGLSFTEDLLCIVENLKCALYWLTSNLSLFRANSVSVSCYFSPNLNWANMVKRFTAQAMLHCSAWKAVAGHTVGLDEGKMRGTDDPIIVGAEREGRTFDPHGRAPCLIGAGGLRANTTTRSSFLCH